MTTSTGSARGREPPHRKEFRHKKKKEIPTTLVESTLDFQFSANVLELEVKLLSLDVQRAEFDHITKVNRNLLLGSDLGNNSESEEETMVDSVKCFDKSSVTTMPSSRWRETRKTLKIMYKLQKKKFINVAGSEEKFVIEDRVGQGLVGCARITTSAITECTERHLDGLDPGMP